MKALLEFLKTNADATNAVATVASATIALAALIVSIAAIVVARKTLQHQREHDILSVRPMPMVSTDDLEHCVSIGLHNNGVGPMRIKSVYVESGGDRRPFLREFMPQLPPGLLWSTYAGQIEDRPLASGSKVTLLELSGDDSDETYVSFRDECRRLLGRVTVFVEFTDIYGSTFATFKEPLIWYSRPRATPAINPAAMPEAQQTQPARAGRAELDAS